MPTLTEHRNFFTAKRAEKALLARQLETLRQEAKARVEALANTESARDTVNTVLLLTQEKIRSYIEEVVSLALSVVYGDEYAFELDYDIKRNQAEVTPWIVKDRDCEDTERFSPRDEVGGGVCDICSFALRVALWSISTPRPAPVFILDEPAKFLSRDRQHLFGEMLRELSAMLGVQIILVSHSTEIVDTADRAYRVTQEGGISRVEEIT